MAAHSEFSTDAGLFKSAAVCMAHAADKLGRPAYVEVERVKQVWLKPPGKTIHPSAARFPLRPLEFTELSKLGRTFRDAEVHITVDHLEEADPEVFSDLFQRVGFKIAYRPRTDHGTSIVATAQGFEPDVARLFVASLDWAKTVHQFGLVRCDIGIKAEYIVWHYLANDPQLMPVIVPGSAQSM